MRFVSFFRHSLQILQKHFTPSSVHFIIVIMPQYATPHHPTICLGLCIPACGFGAKLDFLLSPRVIKPCDCFIKFQRISSFLHYRTSSSISSASTGNGRRQLVDRSDLGVEDSRLSFSRCRLYLRFDGECLLLSSRG